MHSNWSILFGATMIFPWSHVLAVAGLFLGFVVFCAIGCGFQIWCERRWRCPSCFWSKEQFTVYKWVFTAINALLAIAVWAVYCCDLLPPAFTGGALLSVSCLDLYFVWYLFFSSKRSANRIS